MINTNWALLLGLIFGVLLVFTSLAYLITWTYWKCIQRLEVAEINEKHMSLPRPATAPTIMVPETPVTGTAVQFNFSRPDRRSIDRASMYSHYTIPEHMAAGAITSPERAHRRTRSSLMASQRQSRHMHSRGYSRDLHARAQSRDMRHSREYSNDRYTRYHPQYQLQRSQSVR